MRETIFKLKIEHTGTSGKVLHESMHKTIQSGQKKAQSVLQYDVPGLNEWYEINESGKGYVLDRDEINAWPIRIEIEEEKVLRLEG